MAKLMFVLMALTAVLGCARQIDRDLVESAGRCDVERVRVLVKQGAHVNVLCCDGWTPLTVAAWYCDPNTVKTLLELGADVNEKAGGGHTALFWANKKGNHEVAAILKGAGGIEE
jgi:ankyrin repeat protein